MIKCALQTNTIQIKHNKVRIPTGGRLTSWLFTRRGGVEFGATQDKSIQWQGGRLEPRTSGIQVQRPTTRPRTSPKTTGFKPVTSTIPVRCSTNWAMKTRIGSEVNFVEFISPVRSEMAWSISYEIIHIYIYICELLWYRWKWRTITAVNFPI